MRMTMRMKLWINKNIFFDNVWKWVITDLIDEKFKKKQKEHILKKKLLNIIYKTEKL